MAGAEIKLALRLEDIPGAMHRLRRELMSMMLEMADSECDERVARRLREVAYELDCGIRESIDDG